MAPASLKERVDALYQGLSQLVEQVKREYPKAEVDAMLEGLAVELVKSADSGKGLLMGLLDFGGVKSGPQTKQGLEIGEIWVGVEKATVTTRAGETFPFVLEGEKWRCSALLLQFNQNPSLRTLRANMKTVTANLRAWKQATSETTDPSKPTGVFNVVAKAVRRGARVKVYELLDDATLKQLKVGEELVQRIHRAGQKKFLRTANRQRYLKKLGLLWIDKVRGDKALFAGLWDNGVFNDELPLKKEVTIRAVQMKGELRAVLTVATSDGERRFTFTRAANGHWRLNALEDVIQRECIRKLELALRGLSGG
jgi:hypothetical protein